ncbi:uncharacterized protein RAG0_10595 [Rhynchosporium agropyri]|uniref:Helicase C-terminal domain-containing protein n=1 Tax=Rhynchosporium agropyri TaxID=914238 RepID=A0A1E1L0H8_9HELO|nr:uncharacterized protein RAG0_10595 [Rhynchosporium agropyri]
MASDTLDLRELYNEGEREAFFRDLAPKSPDSDINDFKNGLGYTMQNMELLEELITTSFERSGLSEFDSLSDPVALIRLNTAILEPVEWLKEHSPQVPDWFTTRWCENIIERLWKKRLVDLAEKRAKIREGKKPQTARSVASTRTLPDEDIPLRTSSRQGLASLGYMTLQMTVLDSKRDANTDRIYLFPIHRCLLPKRPAIEFASYSYTIFITEMEKAANHGSTTEFINLRSGTVGYFNQDNFFKSIVRSQSFEVALESLYNGRGGCNTLEFFFRKESTAERNLRIDATMSGSASPISPFQASFSERDLNKVLWRSSRLRSPPPAPTPTGPLPPLPTGPSARQLAGMNSRRLQQEQKKKLVSDAAAAAQAKADAITVINREPTSSTLNVIKPTYTGKKTRASLAGSTVSDTNKPLPQVPGGKPRFSDRALAVLHDPLHATPRRAPNTEQPQKPNTFLPRPSTGAPAMKALKASSSTPEAIARKPFLTKGGGLSRPTGASPAGSKAQKPKPPRIHAPPPVSRQAQRAWGIGNKSNATPSRLPVKGQSSRTPNSLLRPRIVDIKRGGTSRTGPKVPAEIGGVKAKINCLITPGPILRDRAAKKHAEVVIRNKERFERSSSWATPKDPDSLTDPGDNRDPPPRIQPKQPKKPTILGVAYDMTKKRMSTLLSPKRPDSQDTNGDVQEIIDQTPEPGEALTPPGTGDAETPNKSSFNLMRITSALRDTQIVIDPATKKTLGLVKISTPRIISTMDRFENQDRRYPKLYTEYHRRTYNRGGDEYVEAQSNGDREKDDSTGEEEEIDKGESDDEAEPKKPGEYMVEQFQKMQNMPELTQMYDHGGTSTPLGSGPWEACCELFQIDPLNTSVDARVTIAGIKTPLYQYQAFGVYWQMKNSRIIGGGFVADEMGLGKTLSFLAYIVAERQLAFLWDEVWVSQVKGSSKEGMHLQPGEAIPGATCPSKDKYGLGWIACPCASSITASLDAKPGVRLAIVPPSLVPTWVEQWDTHVDVTDKFLHMSLVIAHDGSIPPNVDGKVDIRDGRHPAVKRRVMANKSSYSSKYAQEKTHFYPDSASSGQERVLVITTQDHYKKTWATKFEYMAKQLPEDQDDSKYLFMGKSPGIVYGIAMIDECHEDWQKNKGRSALVASLPKAGRPFVWGYSGTPLTTTPRFIEGVLWAIESLWPKRDRADKTMTGLEQEQESDLWKFCWKKLNILCREFENEVKKGTDDQIIFQDFYLRFKPFLTALMLRRTTDTPWFGQPLIKLKPHIHQDVTLSHNLEFDPKIDQFRWLIDEEIANKMTALRNTWDEATIKPTANIPEKFTFNTEMRLRYKQRLFTTFPYLAVLGAAHHPDHLDLSVEELKKFRGVDWNRNPYYKHLRMITEKSPKTMWLYSFISELDKTKDVNGEEQKIVILTEFNQVAFILKLWIEKFIKNKSGRVGTIFAGQKPRDRKAIIEAFTDVKDQHKQRKQKANYQFLVGTTRIIGSGLQLTRSCNVVLMEPDYEFHRELQGYARVHRIGQKNPISYSYRLIDALDELEQGLVKRQKARGELPGRLERLDDSDEEVRGAEETEQLKHPYVDAKEIFGRYEEEALERLDTGARAILDQFPEPGVGGKRVVSEAPAVSKEEEIPKDDLYGAN